MAGEPRRVDEKFQRAIRKRAAHLKEVNLVSCEVFSSELLLSASGLRKHANFLLVY